MELRPVLCVCTLLSVTLAPTSAAVLISNVTGWAFEGETVALYCSTQLINPSCVWHVDGDSLPPSDQYRISSVSDTNFSLTIIPVLVNNTGTYNCLISNATMNETSNALNLSVAKLPERSSITCMSEVQTNNSVVLMCSWPGGVPSAEIELSFNSTVDKGKDGVNRTVNLDNEVQDPVLRCRGNQVGRTSECSITFERPLSTSHDNNAVTSVMEGEIANLTVTLTSKSSLSQVFSWYHLNPDTNITSGGKYTVESSNSMSTLLISTVTRSEIGIYECRVKNIIGSTTFKFNLEFKSQDPGGLSGGAIAGIVIGVLAGVALIGVGAYFLVKKLK